MKKTILPLLLFSFVLGLSGTNNVNNHLVESATDLFTNKTNVNIRKLSDNETKSGDNTTEDNEISYSKMYTQYAKKDNKYYLRFATAIKGDVNSINFVREIDGLPNKDKECTTLYKGISANNKTLYYDGTNAVEEASDLTKDYYWACYTIQFKDDTYLDKNITLSMYINNQDTSIASKTTTLNSHIITSIKVTKEFKITSARVNQLIDFNGLEISTVDINGNTTAIDYKLCDLYENDTKLDWNNVLFSKEGKHRLTVKYGNYTTTLAELDIYKGYVAYGYNMIDTANITENDKYFLEKDEESLEMNVRNDAGYKYAGEIREGYNLKFHIYSEKECNANILLYAASANRLNKELDDWKPTEMSAIQFNTLFDVSYGTGENVTSISIDKGLMLPGSVSTKTSYEEGDEYAYLGLDSQGRAYDPAIWVNWKAVNIGVFTLKEGDNVFTFTKKGSGNVNVYSLEAQLYDRVYGSNIIETSKITESDKNFVEKPKNAKFKVATDAGYSYVGDYTANDTAIFHFYSEINGKADITLSASSAKILQRAKDKDGNEKTWNPTVTDSLQVNKVISATFGENNETINISDNEILPGFISQVHGTDFLKDDDGRGFDANIWVNWHEVNLGTFDLVKGDNIFKIKNIVSDGSNGRIINLYSLNVYYNN